MSVSMTIEIKPEDAQVIEQAIQAGLIEHAGEVVDVGLETLRSRLEDFRALRESWRGEAVRRMQESGEKYPLNLGEPITRKLMHEGHRFRWTRLCLMHRWPFPGAFPAIPRRTHLTLAASFDQLKKAALAEGIEVLR